MRSKPHTVLRLSQRVAAGTLALALLGMAGLLLLSGCSKPAEKPAPKVGQVSVVTVALQRQPVTTEPA